MTRYSGKIGFVQEQVETSPGVFTDKVVERRLTGSVIQQGVNMQSSDVIHDDLTMGVSLFLVADSYSYEKLMHIRYATYLGARWKVINITSERPRLTLQLGGVWNGSTPAT